MKILVGLFVFAVLNTGAFFTPLSAQDERPADKEVLINTLELFPSYESVARWFFQRFGPTMDENLVRFAKDPRGWYVYEIRPGKPDHIYNKQQVWSLDSLAYRMTNYRPVESTEEARENFYKFTDRQQARLYRIHPFYGYTGWDMDVIYNLGHLKNLPDTLLYGLARAYGNYGLSIIRHQYQYSESEHKPAGYEKVSEDRLNFFVQNMNKALECYEELTIRFPEFNTIVGPIHIKRNNEIMFVWHVLHSIKEPQLAKKYLEMADYDPFTISIARNHLASVSPNGLLFSYGDNDSYPLWYLQQTEGFRTDVHVINLSLLNTAWYIAMVKEDLEGSGKPGLISFKETDFEEGRMDVLYYLTDVSSTAMMDVDSMTAALRAGEHFSEVGREQIITVLPSNHFRVPVERGRALASYDLSEENRLLLEKELIWRTPRSYFIRTELMILDILANNNWRFPIHFTTSGDHRYFVGLENYMAIHGFSYKLVPAAMPERNRSFNNMFVNPAASYEYYMEHFSFEYQGEHTAENNSFAAEMARRTRAHTGFIASVLMSRNEKDSARKLLNHIHEAIPGKAFPFDHFALSHTELFLQLDQEQKAIPIMEDIAKQQMKTLENLHNTPANHPQVDQVQQEMEQARNIMNALIQLSQIYDLPHLHKEYEDFMQKISH